LFGAQSGGSFVTMEKVQKQQRKNEARKVKIYIGAREFFSVCVYCVDSQA
jgi:hypothetical protein